MPQLEVQLTIEDDAVPTSPCLYGSSLILFYFILFYFILFYFILFYFIFWSTAAIGRRRAAFSHVFSPGIPIACQIPQVI